ncbi:MAG: O-antigen ligase family protein [Bacteroidales bacterium]|nr:O-antigen ligase family protein [Bacteroidales bacterium]
MSRSFSVSTIYMAALILLVISLPLSQFTMSIATYIMVALWFAWDWKAAELKENFKESSWSKGFANAVNYLFQKSVSGVKARSIAFYKNKPALVFSLLFFVRIIWLVNTTDFSYALRDLRVTLPLLFFALLFSSVPKVNQRQFHLLLYFYLAALLVASLIGFYILLQNNYTDIREISPFIAPIRMGLNLTFGIFILLYFVLKESLFSFVLRILFGLTALWFLIFLNYMESLTSIIIFVLIGLGILVYQVFHSGTKFIKTLLVLLILLIPSALYFIVKNEVIRDTTPPDILQSTLAQQTTLGHPYTFDKNMGVEDGKYVGLYLCIPELKKAWNERSTFSFSGKDKLNQQLSQTLIRYLTSKNLRKDSAGVAALTRADIRRIEEGVANYNYVVHPGFHSRLLKIITGYDVYKKTGNASGSSVMQRWIYLKASLKIINHYFWTGVGTGDVHEAFAHEFSEMNTGLKKQYMHLAHNQFLESFVAFGIFGFLIFLLALFYPPVALHSFRNHYFAVFYTIMLLSMFSDNTLETPDGAFLFAFFSSLLLFGSEQKPADNQVTV